MTNVASTWHDRVLLPGGGEADPIAVLPVGHSIQFATQFDGEAWTLGILGTAINVLVQITPGAGVKTAKALIDALGKAHCFAEAVDTAQTATLSLTTAQNLGSTALDCLAAAAKGVGGLILTAATIVGSLATDLVSGVWAAADTLLGNTTHMLTVQRPSTAACPTSAQLLSVWNAQPAIDRQSSDVRGFKDIRCWKSWVGAVPIPGSASFSFGGFVFYSLTGGLHVLKAPAEWTEFKKATCTSSSAAPLLWVAPVCNIQ